MMSNLKKYLAMKELLKLIGNSSDIIITGSFNNLFYNSQFGRLPEDLDLSMPNNEVYNSFLSMVEQNAKSFHIIDELNHFEFKKLVLLRRMNSFEELINLEIFIEERPPHNKCVLKPSFDDKPVELLGMDLNLFLAMKLYSYLELIEYPELQRYKDLYDLLILTSAHYNISEVKKFYDELSIKYGSMEHIVETFNQEKELIYLSELNKLEIDTFGKQCLVQKNATDVKKLILTL